VRDDDKQSDIVSIVESEEIVLIWTCRFYAPRKKFRGKKNMFLNNVDDYRRAIPSVEHRKVEGSLEDTSLFLRVHGRPVANEAALLIVPCKYV